MKGATALLPAKKIRDPIINKINIIGINQYDFLSFIKLQKSFKKSIGYIFILLADS
jgi:hypothetical protein